MSQNAKDIRTMADMLTYVAAMQEQNAVLEKLLTARDAVLAEIPPCPSHGAGCLENCREWIIEKREDVVGCLPDGCPATLTPEDILSKLLAADAPLAQCEEADADGWVCRARAYLSYTMDVYGLLVQAYRKRGE